jgi:hypothetical protein
VDLHYLSTTLLWNIIEIVSSLPYVKKHPWLLAWISAVKSKKQNISFTYTTDFRVAGSKKKTRFFQGKLKKREPAAVNKKIKA